MTCVIGYVDKKTNTIYMGCDSCGSNGYTKDKYNDCKIFKNGDFIIGYTTSFRMGQILEHSWTPPNRNDSKYKDLPLKTFMIKYIIPSIMKTFNDECYAENKSNVLSGGNFLIGIESTIFEVQNDFSILEVSSNLASVGSGESFAYGACAQYLEIKSIVNPIEMLESALKISSKYAIGVEEPFHFISLDKSGNFQIHK